MNRRFFGAALAFVFACLTLAGCEWLHQNVRPQKGPDPAVSNASAEAVESDSQKVLDVQADPSKPRRFFQPSGRPSGLSPEARDIENSLGIH